ncbi:EamA family transporter [Haloarcula litorea]|uniref:EamA family transporter n=1 Tax=Haloarcula litorea TaxID=3032579 RepID=UPI0023E77626|nr:EamA family transporter [Halomicroarcula sp. GDY20]
MGSLVGGGVLATALLSGVHFELLENIGATKTALAYYAHPISTAIAGNIYLNERITTLTVVRVAVVFTGFILVKRQNVPTALSAVPSK